MDGDMKLLLDKGRIREYEKDILTAGLCRHLLPMGFVSCGKKEQVTYDCTGFCPVGRIRDLDAGELLGIMEKTFLILAETGNHYIPPSRITLNEETVFYDRRKERVRIAYVPMRGRMCSIKVNAGSFIRMMKERAPADMKGYFGRAQESLQLYNYSSADMADILAGMKRELFVRGS